jgi:hypothetical protein
MGEGTGDAVLLAAFYRMPMEENVLGDAFGQEYLDYKK